MGQESRLLYQAVKALEGHYQSGGEIVQCVIHHATAAATAAALEGVLPGAGSAIAAATSTGIIITMYVSLGKKLNVRLGHGTLKALASALVADLAGAFAANLAGAAILSFIPGLGSLGSAAITGLTSFAYVYLAGLIYIKMVAAMLESGKSMNDLSEEELIKMAKKTTSTVNLKKAMNEIKSAYKSRKNCE